jgi:hypothetical protein
MMIQEILVANLGTVQVWFGDVSTQLTLYVLDGKYGVRLYDERGVSVKPKSQRLGYNGRRLTQSGYATIVCDDDVSQETRELLAAAGYLNVCKRG